MAPSKKVLRDLSAGQSTADSIGGRLELETDQVTILLMGLRVDGLVESKPIMLRAIEEFSDLKSSGILVWKLTTSGWAESSLITEN